MTNFKMITHPHHLPSIHVATSALLMGNAVVTLAAHHISPEIEALLFCASSIFAAVSADIERAWNEYFHGHD